MSKTPTWKRALALISQQQRDAACQEMDGWSDDVLDDWDARRRALALEHADMDVGDCDWVAFCRCRTAGRQCANSWKKALDTQMRPDVGYR